jgi:hypothetical protein
MLKIFNVFYLARLCNSIAVFFEPFFCIELHNLPIVLKNAHEQKETANDCASSTFTVIAVKDGYPLRIVS